MSVVGGINSLPQSMSREEKPTLTFLQCRSVVHYETFAEENLILSPTPSAALEVLDSHYLEAHLRAIDNVVRIELIDSNDEVFARYDGCALKESD